ncbi:MAG: amino acid adenylation domain-containing protein [Stenotrophomonas sp.]
MTTTNIEAEREKLLARTLARQGVVREQASAITARSGPGPWPQSSGQQRLWLIDRLQPGTPRYNMCWQARLPDDVDADVLEGALRGLVARHEVLRTTFGEQDGAPVQFVQPDADVRLARIDHPALSGQAAEDALRAIARDDALLPFDLAHGPLVRATLVSTAGDQVLLVCLHHIVADGWSLEVFGRELLALYGSGLAGAPSPLRPLPLQYADYALWERDALDDGERGVQLDYWAQRLDALDDVQPLPVDRPRSAARDSAGAALAVEFAGDLASRLRAFARAHDATEFMVALAAFKALVAKVSGTTDVVVGTPSWNREREEFESLIGFFVNTLVLRTDLSGNPTLVDVLERVRETTLGALSHRDVPFEQVVAHVARDRDAIASPLVRTMFSMAVGGAGAPRGAGDGVVALSDTTGAAKFDLSVVVAVDDERVALEVEYSTGLFDRSTVEALMAHYGTLLDAALDAPRKTLSSLPLLDAAASARIASEWSRGHAAEVPAGDACSWFEERAAATPDAPALVDGDLQLTYGDLDSRANRLANHLRAQGVGEGDVVALALPRSAELGMAMLAVMKAGAAYLPLDLQSPAARLRTILADAGGPLVVGNTLHGALLADAPGVRVWLDEASAAIALADPARPARAQGDDRLAYVIYTSGSTGQPKGVEVTHGGLANLVAWQQRTFGWRAGDRGSQLAAAAFDATVLEWWAPLASGASVHVVDDETRLSPTALVRWLVEQRIDIAFMPTPLAEVVLLERWPDCALRALLTGGDVLHRRPPAGLPFALYNCYGPTETTVVATWSEVVPTAPGATPLRPTIGHPVDGVSAYVLDAGRRPVPPGVIGELWIGGAGVARGYRGLPELTAARFVDDTLSGVPGARMYRTGDLALYRADGELVCLGRDDGQVKIRGYRLETGEVEATIRDHADVRNAVVVRRGDGAQAQLHAFVEPQEGSTPAPDVLLAFLRGRLPDYMVPARLQVLDALPLTANGKVDRLALPDDDGDAAPVAARTDTQQRLLAIWSEVLDRPVTGIHDDFFGLGGHSLLAARLLSRINEAFETHLPLRSVFDESTVAGFALALDAQRWCDQMDAAPPILAVPRNTGGDVFPQSPAQQRMWFLDQLEPGATAYNVNLLHSIRGTLDVDALEVALNAIVQRHESLRTTFRMEADGRLVQVIAAAAPVRLVLTNLRDLPPEVGEARARQLVTAAADTPFDLSQGPLLRAFLIHQPGDRHLLLLSMHHIVTDGWSLGVLLEELSNRYAAIVGGDASSLPPLEVQYADYSAWQDEWMNYGVLEEQLFYWQQQLLDAPQELALPTDRPPQAKTGLAGATVDFRLGADTITRVRRVGSEHGATPFMVLLAAFKALLARVSDQSDIVLGVPVANRSRKETEALVGLFVNTLVLRTDLSGDPEFSDALVRVRETAVGGYAHQGMPLERLIERLGPQRRWQRSPMFQVMFVLQNAPESTLTLEGLQVVPVDLEARTAKFDLTLALYEVDGELQGVFEYSTDLFDRTTVEGLAAQYRTLLDAALAEPGRRLSTLPLLASDARDAIVSRWSHGRAAEVPAGDACSWFEERAAATPDAPALVDGDLQLTYGDLDSRANRLANHLRAQGVGEGDVVALALPRSAELGMAMLAVMKAGAAYLPLDLQSPAARLRTILADAGGPLVVGNTLHGALLADAPGVRVWLDEASAAIALADPARPARAQGDDRLAYVIYTSGSTGQPKGVEVTHGGLANLVAWQQRTFGWRAGDRGSQLAAAAFDATVLEWWAPLASGASVHVVDDETRLSPTALVRWLVEQRIDIAFMPTPLAEVVLLERWPDCALRALLTGGDVLHRPPPTGLPFTLYNNYGPTEGTVVAASTAVAPDATGAAGVRPAIGRPIDGVSAYVLDAGRRPVPPGVVGELWIGGAGVARGYRGLPDTTAERFVEDALSGTPGARMYRTGDRARFRADGQIEFLGRDDGQVKIRGHRIETGDVEAAIAALSGIRQCAVVATGDAAQRQLLAFAVAGPEAGDVAAADLLNALREALPDYMVPVRLVLVDALPLTANGKVDFSALPAIEAAPAQADERTTPPRDPVESGVAELWEALLGYRPAGIEHNFFRYGGHSLSALTLRARIEERFGVQIDLMTLFDGGTIAHIASQVRDLQAGLGNECLARIEARRRRVGGGLLKRLAGRLGLAAGRPGAAAAHRALVPLQPDQGGGAPYFCVHPVGGGVTCYAELSPLVAEGRAVYGLEASGERDRAPATIEDMARAYIRAIRSVQPAGPYHLFGWSTGGVVAFEMARQLEAVNASVASLHLLDSYPFDPGRDLRDPTGPQLLDAFATDLVRCNGLRLSGDWLSGIDLGPDPDPKAQTLAALKAVGVLPQDMQAADFAALFASYAASYRAWASYAPGTYGGRTILKMCAESIDVDGRSPMKSWGGVATGGMVIDVVEGNHYTMLRSPAVQALATGWSGQLARTESTTTMGEMA